MGRKPPAHGAVEPKHRRSHHVTSNAQSPIDAAHGIRNRMGDAPFAPLAAQDSVSFVVRPNGTIALAHIKQGYPNKPTGLDGLPSVDHYGINRRKREDTSHTQADILRESYKREDYFGESIPLSLLARPGTPMYRPGWCIVNIVSKRAMHACTTQAGAKAWLMSYRGGQYRVRFSPEPCDVRLMTIKEYFALRDIIAENAASGNPEEMRPIEIFHQPTGAILFAGSDTSAASWLDKHPHIEAGFGESGSKYEYAWRPFVA